MAKAKKTPSGKWQIRVGSGTAGKSKSFTAETKKEAEILAAEYLAGLKKPTEERTVDELTTLYIESKINILSPTTINGYKRMLQNYLTEIGHIRLCDLTNDKIQLWVNRLAANHSPKTVHNAYGLLSSVLSTYLPDQRFRVTLPKKQKTFRSFPEVTAVMAAVRGTEMELPVLLGLWEGMRMSEIRGAKKSDITDGVLTIHSTIVNVDGIPIERNATKTYESTRQLRLPAYILDLIDQLPPDQEYLTLITGQALYKRLQRLLELHGLPSMRFHDLRHLNASVMLSLGIPDKYAMERGGWSNPGIMQNTYQHTFTSERKAVDAKIDAFFAERIASGIASSPQIH